MNINTSFQMEAPQDSRISYVQVGIEGCVPPHFLYLEPPFKLH